MTQTEDLAQRLAAQNVAYIEADIGRDAALRRARYDAERSVAVADLVAAGNHGRVLEVGVGYLSLLAVLHQRLGEETRFSGLEHPLRGYLADPAFQQELASMDVDLRTCDVASDPIPFDPASFDVVLLSELIEHLAPQALPGLLERTRDLLAPNGRVILSSPNLAAGFRVLSLALGRGHVMDTPVDVPSHPGVYGHMRLYDRNDIELLAAQTGLRVVEWRWLEWERGFIDASTTRGKLLYAAQAVASRLADRWSTSWLCALERA